MKSNYLLTGLIALQLIIIALLGLKLFIKSTTVAVKVGTSPLPKKNIISTSSAATTLPSWISAAALS